jgi:hypothetical protein
MPESPSIADRLRAGLAVTFAKLSAGAHRLEGWTARGTRPFVIGLVAVAAIALGVMMLSTGGRAGSAWFHDGPPHARAHGGPPPKPEGHPAPKPAGKPEGRRDERPRPPAPPPPSAPGAP